MRGQRLALPVALLFQPGEPVASPRMTDRHSRKTQQRFDPVGMARLFRDQPIPFAAGSPGILLLHAWDAHDPNHPRFAAQMGHQGPQQELAVNPVRLRRPRSLLDRNAGRIKDKIGDLACFQQPMQPKAVIAGFVATHDPRHRTKPLGYPGATLLDQAQQAGVIAPSSL
jgi:hypothetical protein